MVGSTKVMTLGDVLEAAQDGHLAKINRLVTPNFFLSKKEGGSLLGRQVNLLLDLLAARRVAGLQTVAYVFDMDALAQEYGLALSKMIGRGFSVVASEAVS